jgi:amino acid transporter
MLKRKSTFKEAPLKKKIGFFSSIIMVICSSMGAGIFIKNHEILTDVHGAIVFVILA